MMTIKEITELRKSGEVEKAYDACKEILAANPEDRYGRVAMAYCVKALGERAAKAGDAEGLVRMIDEYGALRLEEIEEAEMNNKVAWDVRALLLGMKERGRFELDKIDALFDALTGIAFVKPHRYYSVLLDSMLRVKDAQGNPWATLAEVIDWWGLENLLPEDYQKIRLNNGEMMQSLAERAYSTAVKSLLLSAENGLASAEDLTHFIYELDMLLETHPEFQYTLYQKTLLLKALGRMEEAVTTAREFVKRHQNEYWAWSMLGDIVDEDSLRLSCYCRALLCRAEPGFLTKVRQKAGIMMYQLGEYPAAKREFEDVLALHETKGWHVPPKIAEFAREPWFASTQAYDTNVPYYRAHLGETESFLFGGAPETAILVSKFNPQKQTVSYVTEDRKRGFFSTKKLRERFSDNQVYQVRFADEPDGKTASKVMTIRKVDDASAYENKLFRRIRSVNNMRPGQSFTFVDDIYVDGNLLRGVAPGEMADITAVLYYNIKKESWGWRAVCVRPV